MERDIEKNLIIWKNKRARKPLLISGVRQCGKTYTIKKFGKNEFEKCFYLNFDEDDTLGSIFEHNLNPERIISEIESIVVGDKVITGKTLLIFDEIQACPKAISSLKYFCEKMPDLHIIAAGSLLGVALRSENISFPVGKVERLEMYPLNFKEFVNADGGEKYIKGLEMLEAEREIPEILSKPLENFLKNYYIIGGMPEVVSSWISNHNYQEADEIQNRILKDYSDDFGKYAKPDEVVKITQVWESVPVQIAKENNKFIFSHVKKGARSKDLEDALQWLVNAGLVYRLHLVSNPELPLSGMCDATYFKVYFADVGLLRCKSKLNYRTILNGDSSFIQFKGALTENYVLSQLKAFGIESFFWRSDANAEVDFITDFEGVLLPIEVKSADNVKAKSLKLFCDRYSPKMAVKTSLKNIGKNKTGETSLWNIPLYNIFMLKDYLHYEMGWEN